METMVIYIRVLVGMLLLVSVISCSQDPYGAPNRSTTESLDVDVAHVANTFRELELMTPEDVYVNPEIASRCIHVAQALLDDARIEKGPHANCVIRIYMNALASEAFKSGKTYPVNAVVVKDKMIIDFGPETTTQPGKTGNGVGGMIKRTKGFDSDNGDWEYFYYDSLDNIESGKLSSCSACHNKAADTDFVFGDWNSRDESGY